MRFNILDDIYVKNGVATVKHTDNSLMINIAISRQDKHL